MRRKLFTIMSASSLLPFVTTAALWVCSFPRPPPAAAWGNPRTVWYNMYSVRAPAQFVGVSWPWHRWAACIVFVRQEGFHDITAADDDWHFVSDQTFLGLRISQLGGTRGGIVGFPGLASGHETWLALWLGWPLLISLPLTFLSVLAFGRNFRRRMMYREGLCPVCGYSLTGNTSGICPECGTPVPQPAKSSPLNDKAPGLRCL
ncbi:MAG TPA: hypothetical protein VK797_20560 [Tepidisphaeraceae bacterium]|nr:hypothetical protein [Tepidisphaeraceae bacterium]